MTKENVYRAIGNISDKYIIEAMDDIGKADETPVCSAISMYRSEDEGVIKVNVIRKKKTSFRIFVGVVAAAITGAIVTAAYLGIKKENKEYQEKKIENYFKEDTSFEFSDNIVTFEHIAGKGESPLGELGAVGIGLTVGSVSEGGSSVSFGANAASMLTKDAELGLTTYGVQYLSLRRMVVVPIRCGGEEG